MSEFDAVGLLDMRLLKGVPSAEYTTTHPHYRTYFPFVKYLIGVGGRP